MRWEEPALFEPPPPTNAQRATRTTERAVWHAWAEAVRRARMREGGIWVEGAARHGAQFTPVLLDSIPDDWHDGHCAVLDPFAGLGRRLGVWCDRHGLSFFGFDIEA